MDGKDQRFEAGGKSASFRPVPEYKIRDRSNIDKARSPAARPKGLKVQSG